MQALGDAYVSSQSNQFLLSGNVLDFQRCPWRQADDAGSAYVPLIDYLRERLSMTERLVVTFNIARGIEFAEAGDRERARELYLTLFTPRERKMGEQSFDEVIGRSSAYLLPALILLRKLCAAASRAGDAVSIAIILEFFDSIVPARPLASMGDNDRQRLIFFKEWLTDPSFVDSRHLILLLSETASGVHESIRSLPHMLNLNLPLPDEEERKAFIRWTLHRNEDLKLKGSQTSFARLSAGMTYLGIEQTMRLARYQKGQLEARDFLYYLNRLLVASIGDHIEIVQPSHTLADVIGATDLKRQLSRLSRTMAAGVPDISPVGILVAGPNGVGKTFIFTAWAGESDRIVIFLKNLRSSFFGETDQIFEKIRNVLEVLGNVIVIVDEADTVFARPGANTHETEQRLFGNVIKMMGNPDNRAKIVWVLLTARPDNLAPDLKRSGRCGLHIPVFDPEGDDRHAFIAYALRHADMQLDHFTREERDAFHASTERFSPADFRELVAELKTERLLLRRKLAPDDVLRLLADFLPADTGAQRRLQTLHAMLHCSRRTLIPQSLQNLSRDDILLQIAKLQAGIER